MSRRLYKKGFKVAEEKKGIYFVGLEEPDELRRYLLESARDAVDILKKFERFKSVRSEKIREIEKLKSDMREISKLVAKLRSELPKTKLRVKLRAHEKVVEKKTVKKEEKITKKKEMTELDKLESELSAIEGKLKSLG